ncbi:hypothetical protein [Chryseobacterium shigense]|uniref:hypothetical protein n=1 Tax=Chryseobacterium shigense TaxID=297244 RepID=UPI000F5078C3|nr:hypothetical protein [Chryseobacterium shigense]
MAYFIMNTLLKIFDFLAPYPIRRAYNLAPLRFSNKEIFKTSAYVIPANEESCRRLKIPH